VRPHICYHDRALDWSPAVENCIILSNGVDAVAAFEEGNLKGIYQAHTMFAPSCRGRLAIEAGRAMLKWMFDHGASGIWGATPMSNRAARWFNRQIGGSVVGQDTFEAEGPVELFVFGKAV
jgi:hypothetical protein